MSSLLLSHFSMYNNWSIHSDARGRGKIESIPNERWNVDFMSRGSRKEDSQGFRASSLQSFLRFSSVNWPSKRKREELFFRTRFTEYSGQTRDTNAFLNGTFDVSRSLRRPALPWISAEDKRNVSVRNVNLASVTCFIWELPTAYWCLNRK